MWERGGNIRGDGLVDDVKVGGRILLILALADAVDFVVDAGAVMITHLTGTGDRPLDVRGMPGTDTGDLPQTLVCLSRKFLGAPSGGDTLEAVAFGDGDTVDHLVLLEDGVDLDGLLEQAVPEGNLVRDAAAVDLDLHQVRLLLLERGLADLGVGQHAHHGTVLLDAFEFAGHGAALALGVLLGVLGEGLLLRAVPVLVEAAFEFV